MDIKDKLSDQERQNIRICHSECQVLEHLLKERKSLLQGILHDVMIKLTPHPELYALYFDKDDKWELRLKQPLIVPGQQLPKLPQNG